MSLGDWIGTAHAAAQASPLPLPGTVLKSVLCPDTALSYTGYPSQASTAQTGSPPSPQARNTSLENMTSFQGDPGSFIMERTHEAAANLQTRERG